MGGQPSYSLFGASTRPAPRFFERVPQRLALRTLWVLAVAVRDGHDVYLVKRDNPRDKTRVTIF